MSMVFFAADQSLFPARLMDHCSAGFGEENLENPPMAKVPINIRQVIYDCIVRPIVMCPGSEC
jgi:hypothetical protein